MVQHNKPTPEEQLLKLIENPGNAGKPGAAAPGGSAGKGGAGTAGGKVPALKLASPITLFRNTFGKKEGVHGEKSAHPAKPFDLKAVNHISVALVAAAFIYLILDLTVLKPGPKDFLAQVSVADSVFTAPVPSAGSGKKDLEYYQQMADQRNPFLPAGAQQPAESIDEAPIPQPQSNKMTEVVNNLKLVGISWSSSEPLAMIEDNATGRTYFLRQGQEINGVKVQDISKEKVTVTYEGEEGFLF